MANTSILAAFERMWQHVVAALSNKADTADVDNAIAQKSQVQIIIWEDGD